MKIAIVSSSERGETDRLLSQLAARLQDEGSRLAGVVKILDEVPAESDDPCDMDVRVLPNGQAIRITQSLGRQAKGCRLDPGALANAVAAVEVVATQPYDLFVLNKFGPQEAEGRGFCDAIGTALEKERPVLVGVGKANRQAFDAFSDGLAEVLSPEPEAIYQWCQKAMAKE